MVLRVNVIDDNNVVLDTYTFADNVKQSDASREALLLYRDKIAAKPETVITVKAT